jgi:methyl-accepting chemotaxis protein
MPIVSGIDAGVNSRGSNRPPEDIQALINVIDAATDNIVLRFNALHQQSDRFDRNLTTQTRNVLARLEDSAREIDVAIALIARGPDTQADQQTHLDTMAGHIRNIKTAIDELIQLHAQLPNGEQPFFKAAVEDVAQAHHTIGRMHALLELINNL